MEIVPIAYVRSPYKQKFAIPRQPGLVKAAVGEIVFTDDFADANSLRGLEQFSHLWLLFHFHETADKGWSPTVQPPRLGGRQRVGVFATRSNFRPNAIGLSVVDNRGWEMINGKLLLRVGGIDLLDGTPIIDIKPYIPYADKVPGAHGGFAEDAPGGAIEVIFEDGPAEFLASVGDDIPDFRELIAAVLMQDPRPAWRHRTPDDRQYGMSLYDFNIKWQVDGDTVRVLSIGREFPTN